MRIADLADEYLDELNNLSRTASGSGASSTHSLGERSFADGEPDDRHNYTWQENRVLSTIAGIASHRLIQAFVVKSAECRDQSDKGSESESQSSTSNGVNDDSSGSPSSKNSWTNIHVRRRSSWIGDRENQDDDDMRRPPKRTKKVPEPPNPHQIRILACPYHKFDRRRYSENNLNIREREYRGCASAFIRDINRLKQHLYRVHRRPDHYCSCCFDIFESREELDCHIRQRSCEDSESPFAEKMTVDQAQSIKRRVMKQDTVEAWKDIFRTLFPGAMVPDCPYPELDMEPAGSLSEFIAFVNTDGPPILSAILESDLFGLQVRSVAEQAFLDTTVEIAVARWIQRLQQEYQSRSWETTRPPNVHD